MRIALLGAPGSGKGTQAKLLADRYRVPQISTGDLLREAITANKQLDKSVREDMEAGRLVDDAVVLKLLEDRLRKKDTKRGFIIDGYPRSIPQAQALDALLGLLGKTLQVAVNISVEDEVLVKRITGRIGCEECGQIYNKHFSTPKVRNKCDVCSGRLVSRSGDSEKTVAVRIAIYHENTAPLITYYRAQHKLRNMPAKGNIAEIHEKISDIVDIEIRPLEIKTLETAAESIDEGDSTIIAGGQINRITTQSSRTKPVKKTKSETAVLASSAGAKKNAGVQQSSDESTKKAERKAGG
ncbi:MAG: adenylate kinase [Gammaproteobacteria bacterium]|nr:adenylate kinase [Gammaproteobacteria bacterium]